MHNPSALVTGASRGIGREIALSLARYGFDILINYSGNKAAAMSAASECVQAASLSGRTIRTVAIQADIGDSASRNRLMMEARRWSPALHLLVNNAGIAPAERADILEGSEASFDRVLAVNLKAPYFLSQLAAKWMLEGTPADSTPPPDRRADARWQPKIINISSVSAYAASINRGEYCVSKAGLSMVTALFSQRLAAHGINVFEIRPGVITTDMTEAVKEKYDTLIAEGLTPIPRWGSPSDVARAVIAIAEGAFPFSTGEVLNVDGGFHLRKL